jgi:release factor glutamine methyltransferase
MHSVDGLLALGAAQLQAAGVEQARLDARLLLSAATGLSHEAMIRDPDAELPQAQAEKYTAMIARRQAREPVSRILGHREFWSLEFAINQDTLDPRPDSETLISAALEHMMDRNRPLDILDIGTGSGCLLLALLSEMPQARGTGIDISAGALEMARANAQRHGLSRRVHFLQCDVRRRDWTRSINGPFDIVISNPPYIPAAEIADLAPEVARFDPHAALAGGEDGLDFYRIITISIAKLLAPGGWVVLEAGAVQADAIQTLLRQAGLCELDARRDLGGALRAITGRNRAKSVTKH